MQSSRREYMRVANYLAVQCRSSSFLEKSPPKSMFFPICPDVIGGLVGYFLIYLDTKKQLYIKKFVKKTPSR